MSHTKNQKVDLLSTRVYSIKKENLIEKKKAS